MSATAPHLARADARELPPWLPLAVLILLAALLRFPALSVQSIWFDEAATWELMQLPFGEMVSALPERESNPPLFYILEWLTTRAFGDGEFALRALSALAGTLLVPVAYGIGARVAGRRAGAATAALVAVNPLLVWFSQEARSYELVALLSGASLWLFLLALDDHRGRVLAGWVCVSALALCSHYFACFVLAPQGAWLLWRHPRRRQVVVALGALALVSAALLPLLLAQRDNPYDITAGAVATRLVQIPKQFLLGYRGPLALPTGLLAAALTAGGVWMLLRRATAMQHERALLVAGIGGAGVLLPLAGAAAGADYLNARNLIPAIVPFAAALATGFAATGPPRARQLGPALLAALCLVSIAVVVSTAAIQEYQRPNWKGLAQALGRSSGDRVLVISPANGEAALRYYRRGLRPMPANVLTDEVDVVTVAGSDGPGEAPRLPPLVGTVFPIYRFGQPRREDDSGYAILRFRQRAPEAVSAGPLATVHFGERPPALAVLPGE